MFIIKKILPLSIMLSLLTGCGGGNEESPVNTVVNNDTPELPTGLIITSNNVNSTINRGVTGVTRLTSELIEFGGDIDTSTLVQNSGTNNSITYNCGTEGTINVVELFTATTTASAQSITYNNCVHDDVHYHGNVELQNAMLTGVLVNLGSSNHNWSAKQTASLNNLSRTAPVSGGTTNIMHGDVELESSNDTNTLIFNDKLTSSNLSFDVTAPDNSKSSYDFSKLSYTSVKNDSNNTNQLALDFIANHSEVGHMQLVTEPILSMESGLLESGSATLTTGPSTVKLESLGGDNIRMSLDTDNNGVYETTLPDTTWSILMGG